MEQQEQNGKHSDEVEVDVILQRDMIAEPRQEE